ncbi:hypothetical protein B5807_07207 [Epicoccum nigrum]|uniref:Protein ROT1 n=1 Tax=Epicoccum nigrum TaxID=105696 RepID=A0A1Y2LUW2_EPING|nr:hypothetical protein B5807_07207 [Epicoccum nigrum]
MTSLPVIRRLLCLRRLRSIQGPGTHLPQQSVETRPRPPPPRPPVSRDPSNYQHSLSNAKDRTIMVSFKAALLVAAAVMHAQAQDFTDLVGTWSSKSNSTFTGPGFYDPVNDHFTEPKHTGISYSFSADGYFEESYYRAVANPTDPKCPRGIIQWQHGKFAKAADGSLKLDPIKVDGRQMYSDPCQYKNSVYTRYNATETFQARTPPSFHTPSLTLD